MISCRGADLSEALLAATRRKIGRLARLGDGLSVARVHFSEERNPRIVDREICEVVIEGQGKPVRCKVAAPDGFGALDLAIEKLEHQLSRRKARLAPHGPRG
jgi:putative sigma-54 modulation protein